MQIGPFSLDKNRMYFLILLVGFVLFLLQINNLQNKLTPLQSQAATARVEATQLSGTKSALETEMAYATSPAAVEAYARGEAHMVKPGDKLVVVVPVPGTEPTPTPDIASSPIERTPLDTWLLLLFGN